MMLKRMVAIVAVCALLSSFTPTYTLAVSEDEVLKTVAALGILSPSLEDASAQVTRGEMAEIVYNIIYNDRTSEVAQMVIFGDRSQQAQLRVVTADNSELFDDVTAEHTLYKAIMEVASLGIMRGVSQNAFDPDTPITAEQTLKVFVDILGYNSKAERLGGYPKGYIYVAAELGLTRNLAISEAISTRDAAQLVFNALDIEIMQIGSVGDVAEYVTVKGDTLLTKVMRINRLKGQVTDNGVTSLAGRSALSTDRAQVGGVTLRQGKNHIRDFIGRQVVVYHRNSNSEEDGLIVYAHLDDQEEVLSFDINDFASFTDSHISYMNGHAKRSASIIHGARMIYNGLATDSYNADNFDYENGWVTLASPTGGGYSIIIIQAYESWVVQNVDYDNHVIYNRSSDGDPLTDDEILDLYDNDIIFTLQDQDGNLGEITSIASGMAIAVSRNGHVVSIMIGENRTEEFRLESASRDGGFVIHGEGEIYEVSRTFERAARSKSLILGSLYTATFDPFGRIAWLELKKATDWCVGILHHIANNNSAYDIAMSVYTKEDMFMTLPVADKVTLDDEQGNSQNLKAAQILNALKSYSGLVRYKQDDEGRVDTIEIPLSYGVNLERSDRMRMIMYTVDDSSSDLFKDNYQILSNSFSGTVFYNNSSVLSFDVPDDKDDTEAYAVRTSIDSSRDSKQIFAAYATDPNAIVGEYFVFNRGASTGILPSTIAPVVVTKIVMTTNSDGEECYKISGVRRQGTVTFLCKKSVFENAEDPCGKMGSGVIRLGDVLRCDIDDKSYAKRVEILYKADGVNPINPADDGGWIYGSSGLLESQYGNPYTIQTNGTPLNNNFSNRYGYSYSGHLRVLHGYVYNFRDNYMTITTQDLSQEAYIHNNKLFAIESYQFAPANWVYIDLSGKDVTARAATANDIKSYIDYRNTTTRCFVLTEYGNIRSGFIINKD